MFTGENQDGKSKTLSVFTDLLSEEASSNAGAKAMFLTWMGKCEESILEETYDFLLSSYMAPLPFPVSLEPRVLALHVMRDLSDDGNLNTNSLMLNTSRWNW